MSDDPSPRRTWKSIFDEAATWLSIISLPVCLLLAGLGYRTDAQALWWLLFPLAGIIWLKYQYGLAKQYRMEERLGAEGQVSPDWLWTLVTGVLPHKSKELPELPPVMVIVPPGEAATAGKLNELFNPGESLLFHCLPDFVGGELEENSGHTLDGKPQSLDVLGRKLNNCAALVLLDDGNWGRYKRTMEVVRRWGIKHSVRPIMSIQLGGGGGLTYNFSNLTQVTAHNQTLLGRLLAQTANRGAAWRRQASLARRLVLWLAPVFLGILLLTAAVGYTYWSRAATLERATAFDPEVARSLAFFRKHNAEAPPPQEPFRQLLEANAHRFNGMLGIASGRADAKLNVILFAVLGEQSRADNPLTVREVAATRWARDIPFLNVRRNTEVDNIVGCAVAERAFILWTGESRSDFARTDNVEAWDLRGNKVGVFLPGEERVKEAAPGEKNQKETTTPGAFEIGKTTKCWYSTGERDDPRKRLLCAPVGMDDDASTGQVTGAVCISAEHDTDFLSEPWVQRALLNFGNSLSFASWEAALSPTPTPSPSPSPPGPAAP